jgi:enamine deaminase RidA (YjgF/YER057c/UK114 family)
MSHIIFVPATAAPDAGPDVASQTTLTLARVDERLRAERSSLADALVITVYLRRASDFPAMNDAYRQAWKGTPPTRTTVVVDPQAPGAHVEMSAVAAPAGSDRRAIHPSSWMASPNPYSYGIRSGDTLFLSGLIARNGKDNTVVSGDVATQTRAVLENARELLDAAGLSFSHLVSARAFLPDLKDFPEFNRVYREMVGRERPARATVGANLTSPAYNVEVTFVASAAPRQAIDADPQKSPNLSPAVRAGNTLFVSGLLPEGDAATGDPGVQTRDILRKLDALLSKAGFARPDVRDLLVYVTDEEAAKGAIAECRAAFGAKTSMTPVKVALAAAGARVEIMTMAERG